MPRPCPRAIALFVASTILVVMACARVSPVSAQVQRCVLPSGGHVYTDRRCADIGAVERRPDSGRAAASRLYRGGCARDLRDLTWQLATAIDSRDVNAIAALYHWPGMSSSAATATMRRLHAVVQRPLVDIGVVFATGSAPDDMVHPADQTRAPTGLLVRQTLVGAATPSQTGFALRRHMGCWWLQF